MERKPIVLIVEDDEASYQYLASLMRKTSTVVLHAINGLDAVDVCSGEEVSLVLMDLKMPGLDGFEATRRIKSFKPDLPIIAITAYAMSGDEQRALAAGCNDYLAKPLKKELLYMKLEDYGITII